MGENGRGEVLVVVEVVREYRKREKEEEKYEDKEIGEYQEYIVMFVCMYSPCDYSEEMKKKIMINIDSAKN